MRLGVFAAMQINRMNRILFPLIGQFKHSPPDVSPPLFTDQSEVTKLFVYIHEAMPMHRSEHAHCLNARVTVERSLKARRQKSHLFS